MPIVQRGDIRNEYETKFRFIPGAPPGVCATRHEIRKDETHSCEECPNTITERDKEAWMCDASLLLKRRKGGLCYWHLDCLKPAPKSVATLNRI